MSVYAVAASVMPTAFVTASWLPVRTLAQEAPPASSSPTSAREDLAASRKNERDVGIKGHGFVADNGVFTTIDAPRAGLYTVAFGIDESGRTVGGYVDRRGRLHGFLRHDDTFTAIDFPGAAATLASKINAEGQIVGSYSNDRNTPALQLPHGFLLEIENGGTFTPIDVPGAVGTQPSGINNRGQIVGFYIDDVGTHGFLFSNGTFTTITAPGAFQQSFPWDIDDRGQIVGFF